MLFAPSLGRRSFSRMTSMTAFLSAVIGAAPLLAQQVNQRASGDSLVIVPGDTVVDPERIVPHRATWRVTRRDPDGSSTVQGLWIDTWVRSTEDERPVVIYRQLFVDTLGAVIHSAETEFEEATFRALRSAQRGPPSGGWATYEYAGDTASGTFKASATADARDFRVVFEQPVWEPSLPVSVLTPFERLRPGGVVRVPIWNQNGPGGDVTWREIRVDSVGTVVADGRARRAWHLTVTVAAFPNVVTRLWQTPEPPYFWWFVVERPGLTRDWTLVDWEPFVSSDGREPR